MSFVIVGDGFSGVETAGEINEFIRESAEKYYRNIESDFIQINLIAARDHILPEIGILGKYAAKSLEKSGVKILYNTKVIDASSSDVSLSDNSSLYYSMLIWAGGNQSQGFVKSLDTEHDKSGRIIVDQYLRLPKYSNVFALGDCAFILDSTGKPYPPTAQHAIREAKTVSKNLISTVRGNNYFTIFDYSSKGSMAKIGKRDGVAKMLGINLTGFTAWFVWKQYYLSTLPVMEKRIRLVCRSFFYSRYYKIMKLVCVSCKHYFKENNSKFCSQSCRDSHMEDLERKLLEAISNDTTHIAKISS